MAIHANKPSACKITNVVLDIDNVLTTIGPMTPEGEKFFSLYGAVIQFANDPKYYIFPGVIELIQRLYQEKSIRVSFFSKGSKRRNHLFVEKLLTLSLGQKKYNKIKNNVKILSKDNVSRTTFIEKRHREVFYQLELDDNTKDISQVLRKKEDIEDAILIDDRIDNAAPKQIKNLLLAPASTAEIFDNLPCKAHSELYSQEGYRPVEYAFFNGENLDPKDWVKNKDLIGIAKKEEAFEIHFLDTQRDKYKKHILKKENNQNLFSTLERFYTDTLITDQTTETIEVTSEFEEYHTDNQSTVQTTETIHICSEIDEEIIGSSQETLEIDGEIIKITDETLIEPLRNLVTSLNGKTERLCRQANRVTYIAGCLFKALEKAKKLGIPVTEVLFKWQFRYEGQQSYANKFRRVTKKDSLYHRGLDELKKVNPKIRFITPYDYV